MTFGWVLEGGGWVITDTIEKAKNEWSFGKMIFEIDAEDEDELMNYAKEVKSNRLILEKIKKKECCLIYQEGKPFEYLITK